MNEYDIFKKFTHSDEDFKLSDLDNDDLQEIFNLNTQNQEMFKEKYFEFYDDVKSPSKKHEDW